MNRDGQSDRQVYLLIITRRAAAEILLERSGPSWRLPRLEVSPRRRIAEQLTAAARQAWQLETCCLFLPRIASATDNRLSHRCALMEAAGDSDRLPADLRWVLSSVAIGEATFPEEDRAAIAGSLEEMERYKANPATGPFARPGWLAELFAWIQDVVSPLGLRLTGGFRQLNASPTFSLIRIETNRAALWFKAAGRPNAQELPVTVALARLFPDCLPELLGVHAGWNGWLAHEAPGATLDGLKEISAWTRAAKALAQIQIASIGKSRELLESGCQDLRLPRLIGEIDPFLHRASGLMAMQTKRVPVALTDDDLELLGGELKAACLALQDTGIAETLGHLDFNPGNILVSAEGCRFLDWAQACVTHPLITFEYLAEHSRHRDFGTATAEAQIAATYREPWSGLLAPGEFARAHSRSPLVAIFAYAVGTRGFGSPEFFENPAVASYFRSLTRRMYREAVQLRGRSEPCLA
jgi:hypothetical protein